MGAPGTDGQLTIVLHNGALSETAVKSERAPGPSHQCEGGVCTMIGECEWMQRWRNSASSAKENRP